MVSKGHKKTARPCLNIGPGAERLCSGNPQLGFSQVAPRLLVFGLAFTAVPSGTDLVARTLESGPPLFQGRHPSCTLAAQGRVFNQVASLLSFSFRLLSLVS